MPAHFIPATPALDQQAPGSGTTRENHTKKGSIRMSEQLMNAMINMQEQEALALVKEMMANQEDPLKILQICTQAMETVGQRFEAGDYFLPELMMAGEILKQVSEIIKPQISTVPGAETVTAGKVLMGTVKGDIHDIGKDIVTFLLEVNGFDVRDIGIDVPPAVFVEEIKAFQPQVVGMSGLLTLAYDAMKETVSAIEQAGLRNSVKIMIGGGQMSDKIRDYAGADAYGKDAVAGVALAKKWTKEL
jgi:5-methyltetrahydrofolate--homocysteine methyltransferase